MTTYNKEWKNGTDEQRRIIDLENMEIYRQFPELAEMSKEQIESKYKAMKDAFITDAGFDTNKITGQINTLDKLIQGMIQNWIDKTKDEEDVNKNNNKNDDDDIVTIVIPTTTPNTTGSGGGSGKFAITQRGD